MTNLTDSLDCKAINLVCTRCTDGNRALLERWYNDHAQLLMASAKLRQADLYRLTASGPIDSTAVRPDYVCLYHFDRLADFAAFDQGPVMDRVRQLSHVALGRSSIEIVKRTAYERVLNRQWKDAAHAACVQAGLYRASASSRAELERWLNDVLYLLQNQQPLAAVQAYVCQADPAWEVFLVMHSDQEPSSDWQLSNSLYADACLEPVWQLPAQHIARWMR